MAKDQVVNRDHLLHLLRAHIEPPLWSEDVSVCAIDLMFLYVADVESDIRSAGYLLAVDDVAFRRSDALAQRPDGRKDAESFLDACL